MFELGVRLRVRSRPGCGRWWGYMENLGLSEFVRSVTRFNAGTLVAQAVYVVADTTNGRAWNSADVKR